MEPSTQFRSLRSNTRGAADLSLAAGALIATAAAIYGLLRTDYERRKNHDSSSKQTR